MKDIMEKEAVSKLPLIASGINKVLFTIIVPGAFIGLLSNAFPAKPIHGLLFVVQFLCLAMISGLYFEMKEKMKDGEDISKNIARIRNSFFVFLITLLLLSIM